MLNAGNSGSFAFWFLNFKQKDIMDHSFQVSERPKVVEFIDHWKSIRSNNQY